MYKDFDVNKIFYTSSFGTTAALLLKMVPNINQKIFFLNTTYHFQETINYKDQLKEKFNLKIAKVLPESWKNDFTKSDITWTKDTDLCCSINKVEPIDRLKEAQGYSSIGCAKCTIKGQGRAGRWNSYGKTECVLHL